MHNMTRHYLIAALWSSNDNATPQGGEPLDWNYTLDDIAAESLAQAEIDCLLFMGQNADDLNGWEDAQVGHDFWLTRNHHGVGFWDRGKGEVGQRLTKAAQTFRELTPIVGADGFIYFE